MRIHNTAYRISLAILLFGWILGNFELHAQIDFNRQIRPILAEHCFHCHGPDASNRSADLRLDIESEAKRIAIVAGIASDSELIHRIDSADVDLVMPPPSIGKPLSADQKELLRRWIDQGAVYANHWAFESIRDSRTLIDALPKTGDSSESAIDRFLLQKLDSAGLAFSPEVDRIQFIRRATFDLTGLPPTWSEIEAFVNDHAEGSIERLIDRLMESPRYGERWGRHWLDIARYADTHGGAAIGFTSFPFSYTYRDYVINAFNRDLPANQFIVEQIAADQLGRPANDPSLAALGFLTVGMQFRNYHDTIDDKIDVITRGLMGLTVTCARCHDHKFDAIPTSDYYAMYATVSASKPPSQLPLIGVASDQASHEQYQAQLHDLNVKLEQFVRDQSDVLRNRLRMQVGLYLAEIAKGLPEQDVSTQFLSYRTDDLRPLIFNRWLSYVNQLPKNDPVLGPWIEMKAMGPMEPDEFRKRSAELIERISGELAAGFAKDQQHALRAETPKWNPLIVDAIAASKPGSLRELADLYGKVFADEQRLWLQSLLEATLEATSETTVVPDDHPQHLAINSPTHRQIRHHLYAKGTPLDITDEEASGLTNRTISDLINAKHGAIHQLNLSSPGSPPRAMILNEQENPKQSFVFLRGNPMTRGEPVQPRFLSALTKDKTEKYEDGHRRLGLAQSMVSNANPLTPRVLVNWAWQNHFGAAIVRTPDDFGTRGQPPTHPELLDYLADEFRKNGWSIKWLHRQIMTSRAYRQGSIENDSKRAIDPENQLLWRMPRRRLDFESMRDAMLAATEELDTTMGGRPVDLSTSPAIPRRSVYGFTNRDVIDNLMSTFDVANPNSCTAKRPDTTVPQQTLFALNSEFIQDRALRLANQTKALSGTPVQRIEMMFRRILCRNPSPIEMERSQSFIAEGTQAAGTDSASSVDPEPRWIQLAHALLASNEFTFLD
jgi:hypothetical protein